MGGASGGGDMKASCMNVTACGGDVVGAWTVKDSCLALSGMVNIEGFGLICPNPPITGTLKVSGTWTAMADGTYVDGTTTTGQGTFELPPECLNISGTVTKCSRVGGVLAAAIGFTSIECVDNMTTGGCTCTATADQAGGMALISAEKPAMGRYMVESNVIAMSDPIETKYDYCVAGTTLNLSLTTVGRAGIVTGTVLLTK